jgi:hypothetical protein
MAKIIKQRKVPKPHLQWGAREVLKDIGQRPRIMTRITLGGGHFPHRSLAPFVRVGTALTTWVEISDDEQNLRAYFMEQLPESGHVEFGYGNEVVMRFPRKFSLDAVERLDHARLPKDVIH